MPPHPEPPTGAAPPPPARPPLRRSRTDKVIGGVSGGLAENTGIDALLWRVGFIALVFAGGTGFLVYLLLWLLMPARPLDPADTAAAAAPSAPPEPRSPVPGITVAALLIALGLTTLVARTTAWNPGPSVFLGIALLVVGVGLGIGAFVDGRAARGPLIALGVLLSFALLLASVGGGWRDRAEGGVGDRSYAPRTADAVQSTYESGVGDLDVDLTNIDLSDLAAPITTTVNAGLGDVEIVVPRSADVQVSVQNGVGEADVLGLGSDGGFSPGTGSQPWTGDGTAEIVLTVESGVGDVTVSRG
jgi:phage shock protein PspC (stress-responsive transcriptional regulator)